jgi:hypothetical protein
VWVGEKYVKIEDCLFFRHYRIHRNVIEKEKHENTNTLEGLRTNFNHNLILSAFGLTSGRDESWALLGIYNVQCKRAVKFRLEK